MEEYKVGIKKVVSSQEEMWDLVLGLLELILPQSERLTERERQTIIAVLMRPPGMNCFHGMPGISMQKELGITKYNLSMIRRQLLDKEWITEDLLPDSMLYRIQMRVHNMKQAQKAIDLNLRIELDEHQHTGQ